MVFSDLSRQVCCFDSCKLYFHQIMTDQEDNDNFLEIVKIHS